MEQLNKLQIKAEVLTVLATLRAHFDDATAEATLFTLKEQNDKDSVLEILIKELVKADEAKVIIICYVLMKLFEQKIVEDECWKLLKNSSVKDTTKTIILNLLKDLGQKIGYETLEECFDSPEEVIDEDTKRLLQSAIINPEAQIDFLDFLHSLPQEDKVILVKSLGDDYSSDNLANILDPLVMYEPDSDISQIAIDILGDTKSQLALFTLNELLNLDLEDVTKALVKKNISKLKIAGVREENALDFYKSVLKSKPYDSFASYPDGHGNQAIIFSREKDDEYIEMLAVVINDSYGIVDCFGFFNLTKSDFERIVFKFYNNDERLFLDSHVVKRLLDNAEKLTRKNGGIIPYEYICWKSVLIDITPEITPLELILNTKFEAKSLTKDDYEKVFMLDLVQKWFFDGNDNTDFARIVESLNEKVKNNDFSFDLDKVVEDNTKKIFAGGQSALLDKRILLSAYLNYLTEKDNVAELLYSLYYDEKAKSELQKNILRKSLYECYVSLKFKLKEECKTTNIFAMRNRKKSVDLSSKQIEEMISKIESQWVNA